MHACKVVPYACMQGIHVWGESERPVQQGKEQGTDALAQECLDALVVVTARVQTEQNNSGQTEQTKMNGSVMGNRGQTDRTKWQCDGEATADAWGCTGGGNNSDRQTEQPC